jgi:hypothetical protein
MFKKIVSLLIALAVVVAFPWDVSAAAPKKVSIQITSTQRSVVVGETLSLTATTSPKAAVAYQSNNTSVATVTKQGTIKGIKEGKADITVATNQKGYSGKATVTIKVVAKTNPDDLKKVTFKDPILEAIIRGQIKKPDGDLLVKDVAGITTLSADSSSPLKAGRIRDLDGIESLRSLKEIDLMDNLVSDLRPLAGLNQLEQLVLSFNRIQDISPLAALPNLQGLYLTSNFIAAIDSAAQMRSLSYLNLNDNRITDISMLSSLTKLTSLNVSDNAISNIEVIGSLKKLVGINLDNNPVNDISPAKGKENTGYFSFDNIEKAGKIAQEIIKKTIRTGMTDLEKEEAIHDAILEQVTYDYQYFNHGIPTKTDTQGIFGSLVEGYSVCGGYARTMMVLGRMAGLDILYVTGMTGGIGHAWNLVRIEGEYYHVDATWDDGDPWRMDDSPLTAEELRIVKFHKRVHFNSTHTNKLNEMVWDVERYPLAKIDAPSASGHQVKVSINSEVPVTKDIEVWLTLDVRYEGGKIRVFTQPARFVHDTAELEATFVLPADIPLDREDVSYTLSYELYQVSLWIEKVDNNTFMFASDTLAGSMAQGKQLKPNAHLYLTLLKKGSMGATYAQVAGRGLKDTALDANWFELYVQSAFPQPDGSEYKIYAVRNTSSFTLLPHSAIYVTAGTTYVKFEDDYHNYNFGGEVLIANHTDQPKVVQAGEIDYSVSRIYNDNMGTVGNPDGTTIKLSGTGPYIRVLVFDGDFDESIEYKEYLVQKKERFISEWFTVKMKRN